MAHALVRWVPAALLAALAVFSGITLAAPPSPQRADGSETSSGLDLLSLSDARSAAEELQRAEVDAGHAPGWAGAEVASGVPLVDLMDTPAAFLFPVTRSGLPAGYILIAAAHIPHPALEFATDGPDPLSDSSGLAKARASQDGLSLDRSHPLYLGPLEISYRATSPDGSVFTVNAVTGASSRVDASLPPAAIAARMLATARPAEAAASQGYKLIGGVPDWNQFPGGYGCYSGCAPTAATNVIGYWDAHGLDNLVSGNDWQGAINQMRTDMGTWCVGQGGATSSSQIAPGIVAYAGQHGYVFRSVEWPNAAASFDAYRTEMDAGRPMVVGVYNQVTYGDHAVTGVGYSQDASGAFMIVHDNWPTGVTDVYLQYGTGYDGISMFPVYPPNGGVAEPSPTPSRTPTRTPTRTATARASATRTRTAAPTATPRRPASVRANLPAVAKGLSFPAFAPRVGTPTPLAPIAVQAGLSVFRDSLSWLHVIGEVRNGGPQAAQDIRVSMRVIDSGGGVVGALSGYLPLGTLPQGDSSCFHIVGGPFAADTRVEVSAADSVAASPPASALVIAGAEGSYDPAAGWYQVSGQIRNDGSETSSPVGVVATAYDAAGTVVGCEPAAADSRSLAPGASSAFHVVFSWPAPETVVRFRVQPLSNP